MPPPKHLFELGNKRRRESAHKRMRSIVRSVIVNKRWLDSFSEQVEKKGISTFVRTYQKPGMLTKAEKALIRHPHPQRTIEERKLLVKLLSGLLCFTRLPPKLRARLVPCINFMNLAQNRRLINEGDDPQMLYFILTGEVIVLRKVYNSLERKYEMQAEMLHGPGDCIGDIELIENCRRLNTYKAHTEVELLVVYFDDFNTILRPYMSHEWFDKKKAIRDFEYFQNFTEQQVISTCKISQLRQFDPLENIYYEDKGQGTYVHFVLSGECMVLQFLKINVTERHGRKTFDLVRILPSDNIFKELSNVEVMKMLREEYIAEMREPDVMLDDLISDDEDSQLKKKMIRKMDIKTIEKECGMQSSSDDEIDDLNMEKKRLKLSTFSDYQKTARPSSVFSFFQNVPHEVNDLDKTDNGKENEPKYDTLSLRSVYHTASQSLRATLADIVSARSSNSLKDRKSEHSHGSGVSIQDLAAERISVWSSGSRDDKSFGSKQIQISTEPITIDFPSSEYSSSTESNASQKSDISLRTIYAKDYTKRRENHFIDVGSIGFGGIFGLGEPLDHRVIMARTTVQCLMIPRFWLLERNQNPSNVWNRRRFYLENSLPSRETLFRDFLKTRKWQKFKSDFIRDEAQYNETCFATKPQDIPVYGRVLQPNED